MIRNDLYTVLYSHAIGMNPLIELLQANLNRIFVNEDGIEDSFELLPPLTAQEISSFEASLPWSLPDEIRELVRFARGFRGVLDEITFGGPGMEFGLENIFPHAISIAGDGFRNFWVVDLTTESVTWGPIFYVCHDAPAIVYQAPSLLRFIEEAIRFGNKPWKSEIDDVHEALSTRIWRENPGVLSHADCLAIGDAEMTEFANSLDDTWQFVDLRNAKVGDGYSWGRYGANTANRRFGERPVFAYQRKSLGRRFLDAWR